MRSNKCSDYFPPAPPQSEAAAKGSGALRLLASKHLVIAAPSAAAASIVVASPHDRGGFLSEQKMVRRVQRCPAGHVCSLA